jgi:pyruvate/2-oxoglutarate dehydrogenase complex dihydrolipoamide acyltransferase (E2) component
MIKRKPGAGYQTRPFPRMRRLILDAGWLGRRRHTIRGLIELDVTLARQLLRADQARTGVPLSFSAFVIACVGQAVDVDRSVQAYRTWRDQLIVFDDVDVLIAIEIPLAEQRFPLLIPIRAANRRTARDIHDEIRAIQADPTRATPAQLAWLSRMARLPTPARHLLYRLIERQPHWRKRYAGTVGLTSVGMFGSGGGWGIGMPSHTLSVTLGGIAAKPGVADGRIAIREMLNVTIDFDHDIVDGAPAARFVQRLKELVESGYGLSDDRAGPDTRVDLNQAIAV